MKTARFPRHDLLDSSLLLAYQEGVSVRDLAPLAGLDESEVLSRLCTAARHLARSRLVVVDPQRALGVQWEFVNWHA
jgi:hypothetical protein